MVVTWIYEVNLRVDADIKQAYLTWLKDHIKEMLELPCFERASMFEDQEGQWVVQYHAPSREAINRYLESYAKKMRGDGTNRFAGKFQATRRILEEIQI